MHWMKSKYNDIVSDPKNFFMEYLKDKLFEHYSF